MTAAIILAVLAALFLLTRGKKAKPTPSPQPTGWRFLHCHGMPDAPTPDGSFGFPQAPGSVNYMVRGNTLPLGRIAARFTVTGGGFVPCRTPEDRDRPLGPALVSLIAYVGETRYYSRNATPIAAGTFTLAASEWITVDGKSATPPTPDRIGLVFGHEAGRGHGVYATQPATFALQAVG